MIALYRDVIFLDRNITALAGTVPGRILNFVHLASKFVFHESLGRGDGWL